MVIFRGHVRRFKITLQERRVLDSRGHCRNVRVGTPFPAVNLNADFLSREGSVYLGEQMLNFGRVVDFLIVSSSRTELVDIHRELRVPRCPGAVPLLDDRFLREGRVHHRQYFPTELRWYLCDHLCVIYIFTEMNSGTCVL